MGKSKVTEIIVYSWEDADIQMPAEVFSQILWDICCRTVNTFWNSFIEKRNGMLQKSLKLWGKIKDNVP